MIRSQSASASNSSVWLEQPYRLFDLFAGHPPLGRGCFVILAHDAGAAIERILRHFDDRHGDPGRQEVHRNSAAHRPGADHADLLHLARTGVLGDILDLGRLALGEEEILLRPRLGAGHQSHEQVALVDNAFGIGLGDRCLDGLDIGFRRLEAAELLRIGLAEFVEDGGIAARFLQFLVAFARLGQRTDVAHFLGQRDRMLDEFALDDAVDQPHRISVLGRNHRARRHISSAFWTPATRGSRCVPPAPGSSPSFTSGTPELGVVNGDPIVGGQRNFQPAAEGGAMDRRDHRLRAIFDDVDHLRQHGMTSGLPNSLMSAPAKKVWPSQRMTTALIASSPSASSIAATSPCRTAAPSAFTGGLLDVTISTSPWRVVEIGLVVACR